MSGERDLCHVAGQRANCLLGDDVDDDRLNFCKVMLVLGEKVFKRRQSRTIEQSCLARAR